MNGKPGRLTASKTRCGVGTLYAADAGVEYKKSERLAEKKVVFGTVFEMGLAISGKKAAIILLGHNPRNVKIYR